MKIRIRPGLVLTHVCDQSILVSAFEARDYCPYVTILNETGKYIWKKLSEGSDTEKIIQQVNEEYEIPNGTDTKELIYSYIYELKNEGYLTIEE